MSNTELAAAFSHVGVTAADAAERLTELAAAFSHIGVTAADAAERLEVLGTTATRAARLAFERNLAHKRRMSDLALDLARERQMDDIRKVTL